MALEPCRGEMPANKIEIDQFVYRFSEDSFENVEAIEEHHTDHLSYNDFFQKFMWKNVPVIVTGIAKQWECINWTKNDSIDLDYLRQKIGGETQVPVADCNKNYYNAHEKLNLSFDDFLTYWNKRMNGSNDQENIYYLKDWHLRRERPEYKFYETPKYFASDWLNEYCIETNSDDYRFVYMGPKGTW